MLDVEALEAAGFEKVMTTEEWETWRASEAHRYGEHATVTKNYVLERNGILLITEQNTQVSAPFGVQTTVEYPEIVVVSAQDGFLSVTCEASNTELILTLVEEIAAQLEEG